MRPQYQGWLLNIAVLLAFIKADGDTNPADVEFEPKVESVIGAEKRLVSREIRGPSVSVHAVRRRALFGLWRVGPVLCWNRSGPYERYVDGGDLNRRLI